MSAYDYERAEARDAAMFSDYEDDRPSASELAREDWEDDDADLLTDEDDETFSTWVREAKAILDGLDARDAQSF